MNYLFETPRLGLRYFQLQDVEDFFELGSDPEVIRYAEPRPLADIAEARKVMLAAPLADYAKYGYGRLAVVHKQRGELIGFCGIKFLEELRQNEIGYRFKQRFWGQGLATEAALATLEDARVRLGMPRVIALILQGNQASVRVAEKLGMRRTGLVRCYGLQPMLFEKNLDITEELSS